jgi:hypothetical protein
VEQLAEARPGDHRLEVVVVDVRDHRDVEPRVAQGRERLHTIVAELEELGDERALAVDQPVDPGRVGHGAQAEREAPPVLGEQVAVQVVGRGAHRQVGVALRFAVGQADLRRLGGDTEASHCVADQVGRSTAHSPVAEERAAEIEEDG